jgi:hypothetical protein
VIGASGRRGHVFWCVGGCRGWLGGCEVDGEGQLLGNAGKIVMG